MTEAIGWGGVMESMHFFFFLKLRSFLTSYFQTRHCVFTAAGPYCQLSLSHLQIEIDLPDRQPPARGRTLSDAGELPVLPRLSPGASRIVYLFFKRLSDVGLKGGGALSIALNSHRRETIAGTKPATAGFGLPRPRLRLPSAAAAFFHALLSTAFFVF